jgi:hypothetical protein
LEDKENKFEEKNPPSKLCSKVLEVALMKYLVR